MRETAKGLFFMSRCLKHKLDTSTKDANLTMKQFVCLELVNKSENITVSDIASRIRADKPTASAIFNRLYDKKMLVKKENKSDRRSFYVELGKGVKEMLEVADSNIKEVEKDFFSILDDNEIEVLKTIVKKYKDKYKKGK